jgi:hypothetical protein
MRLVQGGYSCCQSPFFAAACLRRRIHLTGKALKERLIRFLNFTKFGLDLLELVFMYIQMLRQCVESFWYSLQNNTNGLLDVLGLPIDRVIRLGTANDV